MAIVYLEKEKLFWIDTKHTSYVLGIVDEEQFVSHVYYGKKIRRQDISYLTRTGEKPYVPSKNNRERSAFLDTLPMEYAGNGLGDYRESSISVRTKDGHEGVAVAFEAYDIKKGKPRLKGLPATFCSEEDMQGSGGEETCMTLTLHCRDNVLGLSIDLLYSAFEEEDVITRSVIVRNTGENAVFLTKVFSASLDLDNQDFEMVTLHGSWGRERQVECREIGYGKQSVGSFRGESSHQEHPFVALKEKHAGEDAGDVYAMHFIYSGNFLAQAERTQHNMIRLTMGIHPQNFCWKLNPAEEFVAPEAVLTYSSAGMGQITRNLHDMYRNHLIRGEYRDKKRPVLINNWEATYFNFNTEKLLEIAKSASELGIEMLVMDDGWFGHRNDDNSSLGDWQVNEEKITGGLKHLVDEVNNLGMKFGIWFEPEMVSPDSKLYRDHPEWALRIPGREPALSRNQYALDFGRGDVREYVYGCMARILRSANIEYVKWDMNRQLSDLGSAFYSPECQGEISHRYVLGLYEVQERLTREFPHLLLENCSGGGARFDPGMLYYSPQIWCSDDTDAIERLKIQEGTAMIYPLSTIGAHVSDCPNHTVGRNTPFETRGIVALSGTFGYELDVTKLSEEERMMIPGQIKKYHRYHDLIRRGDYYRIASYSSNHEYDCYIVVSKDKREALMTFVQVLGMPNCRSRRICLKGLNPEYNYQIEGRDETYGGDALMSCGILIENQPGDFKGQIFYLLAQ